MGSMLTSEVDNKNNGSQVSKKAFPNTVVQFFQIYSTSTHM